MALTKRQRKQLENMLGMLLRANAYLFADDVRVGKVVKPEYADPTCFLRDELPEVLRSPEERDNPARALCPVARDIGSPLVFFKTLERDLANFLANE